MSKGIPYHVIQSFVEQDAFIITASDRISRAVQQGYNDHQAQQGIQIGATLNCKPYKNWLRSCVHEWQKNTLDSQVWIANTLLEYQLSQIIARDDEVTMMNAQGAAKQVLGALRVIAEWQLDTELLATYTSPEPKKLLQWARQLKQQCQDKHWLTELDLYSVVTEGMNAGDIQVPKTLVWLGFDEFPPALQALKLQLAELGCQQHELYYCLQDTAEVKIQPALTETDEMRWVAQQAYQLWCEQPELQIAVILPDLEKRIQEVEQFFMQTFCADLLQPGAVIDCLQQGDSNKLERPFNISAGLYLDNVPLIHAYMQCLQFPLPKIELKALENLVASPYCSLFREHEYFWTHYLNRWKNDGRSSIGLQRLQQLWSEQQLQANEATDAEQQQCPLTAIYQLRQQAAANKASISDWCEYLLKELQLWLPDMESDLLTEAEKIAAESLIKIVDGLSHFQLLNSYWSRNEVLNLLQKQLRETVYQTAASGRRVHILGTLEASGLVFDQVFLMSMHDESWPAAPAPNPFLPVELQKQYSLPRSSAERELKLAQGITEHILHAAPRVTVSYAVNQQDKQVSLSPLFKGYLERDQDIDKMVVSQFNDQVKEAVKDNKQICIETDVSQVEWIEDNQSQPLAKHELARGGTGILKSQGACPFQAFAKYRLQLKEANQTVLGLNPRERGILVHRVLELIWLHLKTSQQLKNTDDAELVNLIEQSCDSAISELTEDKWLPLGDEFWQIERVKLCRMMLQWLQIEAQRTDFEVIETELEQQADLGAIQVRYQIDRIDQSPEGDLILIDYKTSQNYFAKHWGGMRPEEPQMLLYGTGLNKVAAISYANVTPRKMKFAGLSEVENCLPGVAPIKPEKAEEWDIPQQWQDMLAKWRLVLHQLAASYGDGQASVQPKVAIHTCKYCPYAGLCRIDENQAARSDV